MPTIVPAPTRLQRIVMRLAATRPGSWLLSRNLERLDNVWLRLTSRDRTLTTVLTGLPVIRLTTRGAVTGQARVCMLIALADGEKLVVFASNFGSQRHPAWYANLRVHPEVEADYEGNSLAFRSRLAREDEAERYWRQAVAMYPGYRAYKQRAGGRKIPVVVLEPV
jgi:deazaflavin-dependent oxidoreductase (nitroreductase family)